MRWKIVLVVLLVLSSIIAVNEATQPALAAWSQQPTQYAKIWPGNNSTATSLYLPYGGITPYAFTSDYATRASETYALHNYTYNGTVDLRINGQLYAYLGGPEQTTYVAVNEVYANLTTTSGDYTWSWNPNVNNDFFYENLAFAPEWNVTAPAVVTALNVTFTAVANYAITYWSGANQGTDSTNLGTVYYQPIGLDLAYPSAPTYTSANGFAYGWSYNYGSASSSYSIPSGTQSYYLNYSVSSGLVNATYNGVTQNARTSGSFTGSTSVTTVSFTADFVNINSDPYTVSYYVNAFTGYTVTFTESGLPTGAVWYLNVSGQSSLSSTGTTISFSENTGTYSYTLATGNNEYEPSPSSGSFTVGSSNLAETATFNLVTYGVTYTETGLPSGTKWFMNITGGNSYSSTSTTVAFQEPNGTYSYTIATGNKTYSPTPSSSSFTVAGAAVSGSVVFSEVLYSVTFSESGSMPLGTAWYVNITSGSSYSSTTSTVSFSYPNGTYSYTIATGNKEYKPTPSSGTFTIAGASSGTSITFSQVAYNIVFAESGLPSGSSWSVNVSGTKQSSSTTSITFIEPNGSYSYTVASPIGISYGIRYLDFQSTGSITINGAAVSIPVSYSVQYYLSVSASPSGGGNVTPVHGWYNSSAQVNLQANPNSSYLFHSWAGSGNGNYSGPSNPVAITIKGPINETAYYIRAYVVTFTESGLPTGFKWYVNISGKSYSSISTMVSFEEGNGSYPYSIGTNKEYATSIEQGSITVGGSAVAVNVAFFLVTYTVQFVEIGLPSGHLWFASLNGSTSPTTSNTSVSFTMPNGTYPFSISPETSMFVEPNSGDVVVSGKSVIVNIVFQVQSAGLNLVSFAQSGLPNGGEWFVTLNGQTESSFASLIQFYIPNGTYPYSIQSASGMKASPSLGNLSIKKTTEVTVVFSNTSGQTTVYSFHNTNDVVLTVVGAVATTLVGWWMAVYINPKNREKRKTKRKMRKQEKVSKK